METKTGLMIAGAFVLGVGAGAAVGYLMTKKSCDTHTQEAIDEMKAAHKEEIDNLKKEAKNNANETGKEEDIQATEEENEVVKIDKPSITEMSSIVNSYNDNSFHNTKLDYARLKEVIRKEKETEVEEKKTSNGMKVISYGEYMDLEDEYHETTFIFDADTESWRDMEVGTDYETVDDLPFDPGIVKWEDDTCYIVDKESHSIYILEKE